MMLTHHGGQGTRRDAVTKKSRPHQLWRKKCRKKKQSKKRKCPRWVVVWSYMGHRAWQPRGCLALLAGLRPTQDFSLLFTTYIHTLFEIFIFCPKIQLWFPEKNCPIILSENRKNDAVLDIFSCWQLWFHEKNCQKNFRWKTPENVGDLHFLVIANFDFPRKIVKVYQNWIFWTKIWLFE